MSRKVFCKKLKQELDGLNFPPFPGELGQRIFEHISQQAWKQWLNLQIMLINENRLTMTDPTARQFLQTEMEKFLFTDKEVNKPEGFTPPNQTDA